MKNRIINQRGITLIEVLLSITLISILMMAFTTTFIYSIKNNNRQIEELKIKQSTRFALNYIEKRIRECDQYNFKYDAKTQTFEGRNYEGKKVWIDLSGKKRNSINTLLYFYSDKGELRVNKNNENNVLVENIGDIVVREIIEGQLVEVEVFSNAIDYSVKTRLKITY